MAQKIYKIYEIYETCETCDIRTNMTLPHTACHGEPSLGWPKEKQNKICVTPQGAMPHLRPSSSRKPPHCRPRTYFHGVVIASTAATAAVAAAGPVRRRIVPVPLQLGVPKSIGCANTDVGAAVVRRRKLSTGERKETERERERDE